MDTGLHLTFGSHHIGTRRLLVAGLVELTLAAALVGIPASVDAAKTCRVENGSTGQARGRLQDAVDAAGPGDALSVSGTCRGDTTIDKDLSITGLREGSDGKPILLGGRKGRVLTVKAGSTVTVSSLTIKGGHAKHGGGVHNRGSLTLDGVRVQGNSADFGGGIWNERPGGASGRIEADGEAWAAEDGTLILTGSSLVARNTAVGYGGGVLNRGVLELRDSSAISDNSAGAKRRWGDFSYRGGGVYNYADLSLGDSSTISGNRAGEGGGVANEGMLRLTGSSSLTANRSVLYGGGVWNDHAGSVVLADSSSIEGNDGRYSGGGVYNLGTLTLDDFSSIRDNKASTAYATGTTCGPSAGELGGGVDNWGNVALNDSSSISGNRSRYGGGVMNRGLLTLAGESTIRDNRAKSHGGGVYNESGQATLWLAAELEPPGPVQVCVVGTIEMRDSGSVVGNTAKRSGGGVFGDPSDFDGVTCGPESGANVHVNEPDDCASPAP